MRAEPWFAAEIQEFRDHAEVHKDFLELIKTPKEQRQEAGVDEHLATQRLKDHHVHQRAKHQKFRDALRPARKAAMDAIRAMSASGASQAAILRQIVPQIGPKASKKSSLLLNKAQRKDKLKGAMGKFLSGQVKKHQRKKPEAEADEGKEEEEKKQVRNNY